MVRFGAAGGPPREGLDAIADVDLRFVGRRGSTAKPGGFADEGGGVLSALDAGVPLLDVDEVYAVEDFEEDFGEDSF